MRTEEIEDCSEFNFFAVVLEVQDRYTRRKTKVTKGITTTNDYFPNTTDMLALVKDDKVIGNCSLISITELSTREEYLKIIKQ